MVARRGRGGKPELATARWGLVPAWSNDGRFKVINARAETAAVKMSFRGAFLERPAALSVSGWFEWLRISEDVDRRFRRKWIVRDPWIRPGWVRLIIEAAAAAQTADSTVDGLTYGVKERRASRHRTAGLDVW